MVNATLDLLRVLRGAYARQAWAAHGRGDAQTAQTLYRVCCDLAAVVHLLEHLTDRKADDAPL